MINDLTLKFLIFLSGGLCLVVDCWEGADLLALVCGVCEFVTFPLVSLVRCSA